MQSIRFSPLKPLAGGVYIDFSVSTYSVQASEAAGMRRVCKSFHVYRSIQFLSAFLFFGNSLYESHCDPNYFFVGVRCVRLHNVGSTVGTVSILTRLCGRFGGVRALNETVGAGGTAANAGVGFSGFGGAETFL